jgi:hypothetical protein
MHKVSNGTEAQRSTPGTGLQIAWRNVSVFRWKRQTEVAIVNYTGVASMPSQSIDRRQYWVREQGRWCLFFDGAV